MYTEYAYIKLSYLRWTVMPNGQSLVYPNAIQNSCLERMSDCIFSEMGPG